MDHTEQIDHAEHEYWDREMNDTAELVSPDTKGPSAIQRKLLAQSLSVYEDLSNAAKYLQNINDHYQGVITAVLLGDADEAERRTVLLASYAKMMKQRVKWASQDIDRVLAGPGN